MRYHYYDEARYPDGDVAPNIAIVVYTDPDGDNTATLYSSFDGGQVANPFITPSTGIVDFWAEEPALWLLSPGDTAIRPVARLDTAPPGRVNVKDYGAVGDGTTDDTAAFAAVIAAVDALEGTWPMYEKPEIYVPAGRYCLTNFALAAHRNIHLIGEGKNATVLLATDTDGILFDLGTFDGTPSSWYEGVSSGFQLQDLAVVETIGGGHAAPGRTATAIRDNGCGGVMLKNVEMRGFKYAFVGAYGSDGTIIEDCNFHYNDYAIEIGPHCNQLEISRTMISGNGVGVLFEWPCGTVLRECWFVDQHYYDVKFDFTSPTVAGVTHTDSYKPSRTLLDHCAFESGAGMYGSGSLADPTGHIYVGGTTSTPRAITIKDSDVYSYTNTSDDMMDAEDPATVYAFLRLSAGNDIRIEGLNYNGHRLDAIVAPLLGYTGGTVYLTDVYFESGDTAAFFSPWPTTNHIYEDRRSHTVGSGGDWFRMRYDDGENCIVLGHSTDNVTFTERIKFFPAAGKIAFYDGSTWPSFTIGGDPTGAYGLTGDVRFDSTPSAGGKAGWVCVAGGSPGTWKAFGVIDS